MAFKGIQWDLVGSMMVNKVHISGFHVIYWGNT